ncbi:hypothetical protein ACWGJ9_11300 [Curtobacterium citreum]
MRRFLRSDRAATDPILVIAAIVVSLVLLVGGSLAVAALLGNAKDVNAQKDLSNIVSAQAAREAAGQPFIADLPDTVTLTDQTTTQVTSDGTCFGAFTVSGSGRAFYADSNARRPGPVPSPWPAAAPSRYPDGCWWPQSKTALAQSTVTNLIPNPAARLWANGTTTRGMPFNSALSVATIPGSTTTAFRVAAFNGSNDSAMTFGDEAAGVYRLGMQPGKTYTVSGTVHLPAPQQSANLSVGQARAISVFASGGRRWNSPQAPNTAGNHRVSVSFTIPADATTAFIRFYNGSDAPADVVDWTNLMLTEGSADRPYADGGSPGWSWSGAADQSASSGSALGG